MLISLKTFVPKTGSFVPKTGSFVPKTGSFVPQVFHGFIDISAVFRCYILSLAHNFIYIDILIREFRGYKYSLIRLINIIYIERKILSAKCSRTIKNIENITFLCCYVGTLLTHRNNLE